jgi:hypothetical protein
MTMVKKKKLKRIVLESVVKIGSEENREGVDEEGKGKRIDI